MRINVNEKRKYVELVAGGGDALNREFIEVGNFKCSVGLDEVGNITNVMIMDADNLFDLTEIWSNMESDDGFEKASY